MYLVSTRTITGSGLSSGRGVRDECKRKGCMPIGKGGFICREVGIRQNRLMNLSVVINRRVITVFDGRNAVIVSPVINLRAYQLLANLQFNHI